MDSEINEKNTRGNDTSETVQPGGEREGSRASSIGDRNKNAAELDPLGSAVSNATRLKCNIHDELLQQLESMQELIRKMVVALTAQPNIKRIIKGGLSKIEEHLKYN